MQTEVKLVAELTPGGRELLERGLNYVSKRTMLVVMFTN